MRQATGNLPPPSYPERIRKDSQERTPIRVKSKVFKHLRDTQRIWDDGGGRGRRNGKPVGDARRLTRATCSFLHWFETPGRWLTALHQGSIRGQTRLFSLCHSLPHSRHHLRHPKFWFQFEFIYLNPPLPSFLSHSSARYSPCWWKVRLEIDVST